MTTTTPALRLTDRVSFTLHGERYVGTVTAIGAKLVEVFARLEAGTFYESMTARLETVSRA